MDVQIVFLVVAVLIVLAVLLLMRSGRIKIDLRIPGMVFGAEREAQASEKKRQVVEDVDAGGKATLSMTGGDDQQMRKIKAEKDVEATMDSSEKKRE